MNYWDKITTTLNNVTGNNNIQQLTNELKKRQRMIKEYQADNNKLKQDIQFINQSYQQLEKDKKLLETLNTNTLNSLTQTTTHLINNYQSNIIQSVVDSIVTLFNQQFGQDVMDINCKFQLDTSAISSQYLSKLFYEVREHHLKDINRHTQLTQQIRLLQTALHQSNQQHLKSTNILKHQMQNSIKSLEDQLKAIQLQRNTLKASIQEINQERKIQSDEHISKNKTLNENLVNLKIQLEKKQKGLYEQCQTNKYNLQQLQSIKKSNLDLKSQNSTNTQLIQHHQTTIQKLQGKIFTIAEKLQSIQQSIQSLKQSQNSIRRDINHFAQNQQSTNSNFYLDFQSLLNSFTNDIVQKIDQIVQSQTIIYNEIQCQTYSSNTNLISLQTQMQTNILQDQQIVQTTNESLDQQSQIHVEYKENQVQHQSQPIRNHNNMEIIQQFNQNIQNIVVKQTLQTQTPTINLNQSQTQISTQNFSISIQTANDPHNQNQQHSNDKAQTAPSIIKQIICIETQTNNNSTHEHQIQAVVDSIQKNIQISFQVKQNSIQTYNQQQIQQTQTNIQLLTQNYNQTQISNVDHQSQTPIQLSYIEKQNQKSDIVQAQKDKVIEQEIQANEIKAKLIQKQNLIISLQNNINQLKEKNNTITSQLQNYIRIQNQSNILKNNNEQIQLKLQNYINQNQIKHNLLLQKEEILKQMQTKLSQIQTLNIQFKQKLQQLEKLQNDNSNYQKIIYQKQTELRSGKQTIENLLSNNIQKDIQNRNINQKLVLQQQNLVQAKNNLLEIQDKLIKTQNELTMLRQQFNSQRDNMQKQLQKNNQRLHILEIQIRNKEQNIKSLSNQIKQLQNKLLKQVQQKKILSQDLDIMNSVNQDFQQKYRSLYEKEQRVIQLQKIVSYFKEIFIIDLNQKSINEISANISEIKNQLSRKSISIQNLKVQNNGLYSQLNILKDSNKKILHQLSEKQSIIYKYQTQNQILKQQIKNWNSSNQQSTTSLQLLKSNLKEKQLSFTNQIQQIKLKLKQQSQNKIQLSAKLDQKQIQFNKIREKLKQQNLNIINQWRKQKAKWQNQMGQLNKKFTTSQEKLYQEINFRDKQLEKYRFQLQKNLKQTSKQIQKAKKQSYQRISQNQLVYKTQKNNIEKKKNQQISKFKEQIENQKKQIVQKNNQIQKHKLLLIQERKNLAKSTAQLQDTNYTIGKYEQLQNYANQLSQKLLFKDQQMKKVYINMQTMKSTISELQEGIQIYQSYAEQKGKEIDEMKENEVVLNSKILQLQSKIEKITANLDKQRKSNTQQIQKNKMIQPLITSERVNSDYLQPIKNIFLKYFQAGASYEQKVQSLNLLCQILKLNKKEQQTIHLYKRTKLYNQEKGNQEQPKNNETIQSKLFSFLTAD